MNLNLQAAKNYRKKHKYSGYLLRNNPVLTMGLALPFAVVATTSMKNGVSMALEMMMIHLPTMLLALLIKKNLPMPRWLRILANVMISTVFMVLARAVIVRLFQDIPNSMGAYLYLLSINSMTLLQADTMDRKTPVEAALAASFASAMGFALVVCSLSFFREVAGNGTIWGVAVPWGFKLRGLLTPFSGFILVGVMVAFFRSLNRRVLGLLLLTNRNRI
ncbi:Rnf-Nqr domain containing protein [Oscillospiraceae bacterium MB08-C2-2]|nr:Rnf-Nqr domain containing protein [Oscillospiraceae bacterium MB08-C2-2]